MNASGRCAKLLELNPCDEHMDDVSLNEYSRDQDT